MASFVLTGFSSAARTLVGNETGFLTNHDAELVVTGADALVSSGAFVNYLTVNGTLAANSPGNHRAVEAVGGGIEMIVGPSGFVSSSNGDTILATITSRAYVQNTGTIMSGEDAVQLADSDGNADIDVINSGIIQAFSDAVVVDGGTGFTRIVNSGDIVALNGYGIYANWQSGSTGNSFLHNTGTITGGAGSYTASSGTGANNIYNAGVMNGNIYLDDGNDRYEGGGGSVVGRVYGDQDNDTLSGGALYDELDGGSGDDLLVGRGGDDYLFGGADEDMLLGGEGNDEMDGGSGNDTMNGNAGDDTIIGGSGNDILVGQDGSDLLEGGSNNDTMDGGNGDDILEGESGNDILRGRAGEDDLAGGLGFDLLTGGQDADNFVFRSTAETVVGANRDQILDFEQGVDLIVVAGLSPGVFEFRGTGGFAPSGNPELRLVETATGSTIVQLDANGDGAADAEIRVANVTGLTADDFVL
ncbi:calcium-binding protein [Antarctobacter jejuensis]|uniref:calcium-binding protein n=1 Tax=Antarctobacter jejuensis TaxID=1439938 RepID=UPI003FD20342